MANRVVVGTQWGDEGKGKIVDLLASSADWVARYSGGANAGHTVKIGSQSFALHLVPTGILAPRARCVIGSGMVLDLPRLFEEIDGLGKNGIAVDGRLFVAASAHLVLPHHKHLEARAEGERSETDRIGTTMRGIGPAYADKVGRRGVRAADLINPNKLRETVTSVMTYWDDLSVGFLTQSGCLITTVIDELMVYRERLVPMLVDPSKLLDEAMGRGESILFEGAQGILLDIDFGTYPYVTSSNTITGSVFTGLGVGPRAVDEVIGVVKAYTTRVGNGPFPTEATNADGQQLRDQGNEFGTTTGRSRRCGWLDLVALKYAVRVDGLTHVAITKLDVLDSFEEIPVCIAYELDGSRLSDLPLDRARLGEVKPVYKKLPGWKQTTFGLTDYDDLPSAAKDYLKFICDELGVRLLLVSTGPRRDETIFTNRNAHPIRV
jgi:adenylosuccinate synthase